MASITQRVARLIGQDPILRGALDREIVNMNGLARYLIERHDLDASEQAVVSAIRRYDDDTALEKRHETAREVIQRSLDVTVTSNITRVTLDKTKEKQGAVEQATGLVDYEHGEIMLVIQGEQKIKLLFNEKNKHTVLDVFDTPESVHNQIAEISIQLPDDAMQTPGVLSLLSTELMLQGINIVETMSCLPEMLFFVDQDDVTEAYDTLFSLTQG